MKRATLLLAVLMAALALAGCPQYQPRVVSKVPLLLEPMPPKTLVMVGTGPTAEAAEKVAIDHLATRVILPPTEPADTASAEFVQSMIRGYNVTSSQQDLRGLWYVTVELTVSQLGTNYQELYHAGHARKQEVDLLKSSLQNEHQLRELAEQREKDSREELGKQKEILTGQIMALQQQLSAARKGPQN